MNEQKAVKISFIILGIVLILFFFSRFITLLSNNKEGAQKLTDTQLSEIVFESAPRIGSVAAPLTIIEYGDFQCPACKTVSPIMEKIRQKYSTNISHIWIHTPNVFRHNQAMQAARASQCAHEQARFLDFHDELFINQQDLSVSLSNQIAVALNLNKERFESCLQNEDTQKIIDAHQEFSQRSGVSATPTIVIGTETIEGEFSFEQIDAIIQQQLSLNTN